MTKTLADIRARRVINGREETRLTLFTAFWLGLNTARKETGLPELLYGEAQALWNEADR